MKDDEIRRLILDLRERRGFLGFAPLPGEKVWDMLTVQHRETLAAALALAEATRVWYSTPQAGFGSDEKRDAWAALCGAVTSYCAAKASR